MYALLEHDTLGEDDILKVAGIEPVKELPIEQSAVGASAASPAD